MPTKIVRTEPIIETPALYTTTDTPSPEKILQKAEAMTLKMMPTKIDVEISDPPPAMEAERPAERMMNNSKDTSKKLRTHMI
jgi:hypothetical protein